MRLRQSEFTYSACRRFTKSKEKMKIQIKGTGDSRYIYQNEVDRT